MSSQPPARGFTLIELLVVVTIMMIVLGLVGGTVTSGVARAQSQTEIITLYSVVKKSGTKAFTSGQALTLTFAKGEVQLTGAQDRVVSAVKFKHLIFEPQYIVFNHNGMPNSFTVEVEVRGKGRVLDFGTLFRRVTDIHARPQPDVT